MATVSDCIAEAQSYLLTGFREDKTTLSAPYTAGGTTLSFPALGAINQNTRLSIDNEIFYVLSVSAASNPPTATVIGGQDGSTAANHTQGAIVTVNPKFSTWDCFRAFNREVGRLSASEQGLFQIQTIEVTFNAATYGYDLTGITNLIDVYDVRYKLPGPYKTWPRVRSWDLVQNSDTTDFPSGNTIRLNEAPYPGFPIRVWCRCGFNQATALTTDLQTTVGLPATANDIPALGIAVRLQAGREIKRNFLEVMGEPRRYEEVPPGANLGASRELKLLYEERVREEAARLAAAYPKLQKMRVG